MDKSELLAGWLLSTYVISLHYSIANMSFVFIINGNITAFISFIGKISGWISMPKDSCINVLRISIFWNSSGYAAFNSACNPLSATTTVSSQIAFSTGLDDAAMISH